MQVNFTKLAPSIQQLKSTKSKTNVMNRQSPIDEMPFIASYVDLIVYVYKAENKPKMAPKKEKEV